MRLREGGNMERWLPDPVGELLDRFHRAGYEAYVVGGCVRDALLGRKPQDWDICTSAFPEETLALFGDCRVYKIGLRHGTVMVTWGGEGYEITTYRQEGAYRDHRHPAEVTFVRSLREDLARRDFTINAMAWNVEEGLVDCFGGAEDLKRGLIRCVGEPERRFDEDGLRVLRALRFAARYGFALEERTAQALHGQAHLLREISGERIWAELREILTAPAAVEILREYRDVFAVIMPELEPMFDHPQYNFHHCYDVWEHTLHAVGAVEPEFLMRFTMLLHDSGKPRCFTRDGQGVGHFHGHPAESVRIAEHIMERLRCDGTFRKEALELIEWHDKVRIFTRRSVKRILGALGETQSRRLFRVMRADAEAQSPETLEAKLRALEAGEALLERLIQEEACCTVGELAVGGDDLMAEGEAQGKRLGALLQALLEAVLDDRVENRRETLLAFYREHLR